MLRTLIRLSNGTEISSGSNADMNIRSCTVTQCVNSDEELTIGSVCAACAELVIQAPDSTVKSEDVFTLYKVDDAGNRTQVGVFNVKTAQKKGYRLHQITAYDNIVKLDTDLTEWFSEYASGIPQDPTRVIDDICEQCGVTVGQYPNWSATCHGIPQFQTEEAVTGRKLLRWIAEILGYFCIADPDGKISFRWYRDNTQVVLSGAGDRYRLQGSYKWKNEILPIDSVKVVLSNGIWGRSPAGYSPSNQYIIKNNPFLGNKAAVTLVEIAEHIMNRLAADSKVFLDQGLGGLAACEVSTPASLDINVGDIIIVDAQDPDDLQRSYKNFMRVMTKIQKGNKDTLICTGSYRRQN